MSEEIKVVYIGMRGAKVLVNGVEIFRARYAPNAETIAGHLLSRKSLPYTCTCNHCVKVGAL